MCLLYTGFYHLSTPESTIFLKHLPELSLADLSLQIPYLGRHAGSLCQALFQGLYTVLEPAYLGPDLRVIHFLSPFSQRQNV